MIKQELKVENDKLKISLAYMLDTFDRGLKKGTLGKNTCDRARKALKEKK